MNTKDIYNLVVVVAFLLFLGWCANTCNEAENAVPKSAPTPRNHITDQFSAWDGSHNTVKTAVKAAMHDPSSFKHVDTYFSVSEDSSRVYVTMKYRGSNAFGATVTNTVRATCDRYGRILEIE